MPRVSSNGSGGGGGRQRTHGTGQDDDASVRGIDVGYDGVGGGDDVRAHGGAAGRRGESIQREDHPLQEGLDERGALRSVGNRDSPYGVEEGDVVQGGHDAARGSAATGPLHLDRGAILLLLPRRARFARHDVVHGARYLVVRPPLTPWLLHRAAGQPTTFVWTIAILATSYFFIEAIQITVTLRFPAIFFPISYVSLMSVAITHFIGSTNGAAVVNLLTFYAAQIFGHTIAEYVYYAESEAMVIPPISRFIKDQK